LRGSHRCYALANVIGSIVAGFAAASLGLVLAEALR
jgi:hypothetical protein